MIPRFARAAACALMFAAARVSAQDLTVGLSTPITGRTLALTPGKHRITFQIGGDKYTFTVTVKAGETVTLDKMLQ